MYRHAIQNKIIQQKPKLIRKMNKLVGIFISFLSWSVPTIAQDQVPNVVSGKIERIENFESKYISPRNIDVWLPEAYDDNTKYPVLYMHDGQMLFDPEQTWNKQAWNIDDVASVLFKTNIIPKFIVVGIWNGGQTRHTDYFPQKPFEKLTPTEKDTVTAQLKIAGRTNESFKPQSDQYLSFIIKELMPYIEKNFAVYSGKEHTYIAGSSMGGLISIYAICEYPDQFEGAACLSTHWPGTFTLDNNPIPDAFLDYLQNKLPDPNKHKIYFDYGDHTLDALYPEIQKKVDSLMIEKGYSHNNWLTKYFPGNDHSEQSWHKRLHYPLEFLFSK